MYMSMLDENLLSASRTFEPKMGEVRPARAFTARKLTSWGLDSIFAEIIVGELSVNAVLHGKSSFTVEVVAEPGHIRVGVHDENPKLPTREVTLPETRNGRGLNIVEGLSNSWGVQSFSGDGKLVWADLPAEPSRPISSHRHLPPKPKPEVWEGASTILASWARLQQESSVGKADTGGS
jgi:Histidine kinase-like ATPase domain